MKDDVISVREGLASPKSFLVQFARRARTRLRALLHHPYQALFGFREAVATPVPPSQPETTPAPPVETETERITQGNPAWPNLGLWPWLSPAQVVPAKMPNGKPWPRISIVTPSYQQGEFIERTIRSVLLQGYPNLEYIVVDGGSTDYTQTILRRYTAELDVCISEADDGQAAAINKGFRHSTGEILGWLNSDDMHLPSTLIEVALAFENAKALCLDYPIDLVCGRTLLYSENAGAIVNAHRSKFSSGISRLPIDLNDFDGVWQKSPGFFYQPEVFFTLDIWKKAGSGLNPFLHYALDYDLWIRMAKLETFLYSTDAYLAIFRLHDKQKTKFGDGITYPEHQAISRFHRQNTAPDASYVPDACIP
jgi:GT2 family glycosyltransferase